MTPESALVYGPWVVVTDSLVLAKFLHGEQIMFVGEDFFVPRAQVTHGFVMDALDMPVEVRPSPARNIARRVWTVISKQ